MFEKPVEMSKPRLNKRDQLAQASIMMQKRLFDSATIAQLADEFNLDVATVRKRLALAREDGVPDEAREVFIREMLPASMAVIQEALKGDDMKLAVQVALKIVEGLKAMELPGAAVSASAEGEELTLEAWRAKITKRTVGASGDANRPAGPGEGDYIDATVETSSASRDASAGESAPQPILLPSGSLAAPDAPGDSPASDLASLEGGRQGD